jgi:ppGpp synthetase/RelA/SpoT-type nucleotidyltranferase
MNYIRMIVKEFNERSDLYRDYGFAVQNLLESILKQKAYKYQLNSRLKNIESIKEKIKRKRNIGKIYKSLNDIEDIMGIRVVFYTENDKKKFLKDLVRIFGIVSKIEEESKVSGYRSTHAIISFDKDRLRLEEYKRFKGLKCEVQMTLILDHAWAEVEHDIFYKENTSIKNVDKEKYLTFKERMEKVMSEHIQKASIGLENIVGNIRKLDCAKVKVIKHF